MFKNLFKNKYDTTNARLIFAIVQKLGMTPEEFADLVLDEDKQLKFMDDLNEVLNLKLRRKKIQAKLTR